MSDKVTVQDVERVAELAHLELAPEETTGMLRDLNAILDYVAELNEIDTRGVEPLAQVSELQGTEVISQLQPRTTPQEALRLFEGGPSSLRNDAVVPSLDRAAVMRAAPETDGAFFKVPKVIEKQ
jgi:aspartyl-tRNA(Asn)/glutamyl-tRNA(Gln) amidotransferase subunit C